jgi:molybdopterin synthase catalytic subunit
MAGKKGVPEMIRVVDRPMDVAGILASVADPGAGGTALFVGTTRNFSEGGGTTYPVTRIIYEAYEPMALKVMKDIAAAARSRWDLTGVAAVHRVGRVEIGEASVVIAVSAAHRAEAFEACRFIIDEVKREAPIWKKEVLPESERWVGL